MCHTDFYARTGNEPPQLHRPDTAESDLQTLHLCGCCALLMLLARCMGVAMVLLGWDSAHRPSQHNTPPMMTSADFDSFAVVAPATAESTTPATAAGAQTDNPLNDIS